MVKANKEFDDMIDPVEMNEPDRDGGFKAPEGIWMRGLMMLILAFMFALAETVLAVVAVVQFLWMLFTKEKNALLADFGVDLGQLARRRRALSVRRDRGQAVSLGEMGVGGGLFPNKPTPSDTPPKSHHC